MGLGIKRLTAIPLVEDFSNILAHHFLALFGTGRKWGKNMVGKNISNFRLRVRRKERGNTAV
jgi:hypothetical protein